jgi:hypothetical protein
MLSLVNQAKNWMKKQAKNLEKKFCQIFEKIEKN